MRRTVFLSAFCAALFVAAPAAAELRIYASSGGEVTQYVRLFQLVRASGERVVIDGPCYSACTLVLSLVPTEKICVTPRAVLGFHAARLVDRAGNQYAAKKATRLVDASYPAPIRAWIRRQGGLTSKSIFLRGRALAAIYPRCR